MSAPSLLALAASDTLALAMVAILSFALGMIVTIFFTMIRSSTDRPEVDCDDLLEDEEERGDDKESSHNVAAADPPKDPREPWEQDPEWWRR